ncbi:hypothetical protein [Haladaptatus sp. DYF46]|uniref:hypothetical protein n=1 Tax=Haladaptatus sp. DYF46 TaxID=2886041 RepID=UPI001E2E3C23|nr:hypothetical protein [Haladaptatus sp. DYF46]
MSRWKYIASEIAKNGARPTWWTNRFLSRVYGPLQSVFSSNGISVVDEEWDTLIILDACRHDLFEEVVEVEQYDSYSVKYSAGSATNEWCRNNFSDQALTDTVYVTGNPVVSRSVGTAFHKFVEVWRHGFDDDLGTVPPSEVTDAALATQDQHPDKRLIVHYLQPHYPFINHPGLRYSSFKDTDKISPNSAREGASDVWEAIGLGLVDKEAAWEGYRENLEYVLHEVKRLLRSQSGVSVITSDHGNGVGEQMGSTPLRLYGHPPNVHHPVLRHVPWAVINAGPEERSNTDDGDLENKLRTLGYL